MNTEKSHYMSPERRLCTGGRAWKGKEVSEPADHTRIHCQWLPATCSNSAQEVLAHAYGPCAYVHAGASARAHARACGDARACVRAHACGAAHARVHAHAHARVHACADAHARACADARARAHVHDRAHADVRAFEHIAQPVMEEKEEKEEMAEGLGHMGEMHMHDLLVQIDMHKVEEKQWVLFSSWSSIPCPSVTSIAQSSAYMSLGQQLNKLILKSQEEDFGQSTPSSPKTKNSSLGQIWIQTDPYRDFVHGDTALQPTFEGAKIFQELFVAPVVTPSLEQIGSDSMLASSPHSEVEILMIQE
ncbi:hypothetical protein ACH5RR_020141 [Cinchona calisaya]|uniref:Uncharacterized protein n=1 Tax=Cinchona calisaya TaxID=153742 RepID=A0ABD2ZGL1_9GENT